jgi:hypothetical protein
MKNAILCALLIMLVLPLATSCGSSGVTAPATTPTATPAAIAEDFISGIAEILPDGWTMNVTSAPGEIGHPHGLNESLFRIDFVDPTHKFEWPYGQESSPSLRLHFYNISEKSRILEIIQAEAIYSWDIPIYFDETAQYIVVSSPSYINGGCYTDEATSLYKPLDTALKEYFTKDAPQSRGTPYQLNLNESTFPHSMKGWELYSWSNGSEWHYSILVGTNRMKTCDEVMTNEAIVTGIGSLKTALAKFPYGEYIMWMDWWLEDCWDYDLGNLSLPSQGIVDEIKQYCTEHGLTLNVAD